MKYKEIIDTLKSDLSTSAHRIVMLGIPLKDNTTYWFDVRTQDILDEMSEEDPDEESFMTIFPKGFGGYHLTAMSDKEIIWPEANKG